MDYKNNNIKDIICTQNGILLIMNNGALLAQGHNVDYELGLKELNFRSAHFKHVTSSTGDKIENVESVYNGPGSTFIVKNSELWACGSNFYGNLSIDSHPIVNFEKCSKQFEVKDINCDKKRTYLVTSDGKLMVAGDNSKKLLGLPDLGEHRDFVLCAEDIKRVIAPDYASVYILKNDNKLYCIDEGSEIMNLVAEGVVDIYGNGGSIFYKDESSKLYASGANTMGKLGIGTDDGLIDDFTIVPGVENVTALVSSSVNTWIITEDSGSYKMMCCGYNGFKSIDDTGNQYNKFVEVGGMDFDCIISCGLFFMIAYNPLSNKLYINGDIGLADKGSTFDGYVELNLEDLISPDIDVGNQVAPIAPLPTVPGTPVHALPVPGSPVHAPPIPGSHGSPPIGARVAALLPDPPRGDPHLDLPQLDDQGYQGDVGFLGLALMDEGEAMIGPAFLDMQRVRRRVISEGTVGICTDRQARNIIKLPYICDLEKEIDNLYIHTKNIGFYKRSKVGLYEDVDIDVAKVSHPPADKTYRAEGIEYGVGISSVVLDRNVERIFGAEYTGDRSVYKCQLCSVFNVSGIDSFVDPSHEKRISYDKLHYYQKMWGLSWRQFFICPNEKPYFPMHYMLISSHHVDKKIPGSQFEILNYDVIKNVLELDLLIKAKYSLYSNYAYSGSQEHFHIQMFNPIKDRRSTVGLDNIFQVIVNNIRTNLGNFIKEDSVEYYKNTINTTSTPTQAIKYESYKTYDDLYLTQFKDFATNMYGVVAHCANEKYTDNFPKLVHRLLNTIESTDIYTFGLYFICNSLNIGVILIPREKYGPNGFNPIGWYFGCDITQAYSEPSIMTTYESSYDGYRRGVLESQVTISKEILFNIISSKKNVIAQKVYDVHKEDISMRSALNNYILDKVNNKQPEERPKIFIILGASGIGKTTMTNQFLHLNYGFDVNNSVFINRDDILYHNDYYSKALSKIKKAFTVAKMSTKLRDLSLPGNTYRVDSDSTLYDLMESSHIASQLSVQDMSFIYRVMFEDSNFLNVVNGGRNKSLSEYHLEALNKVNAYGNDAMQSLINISLDKKLNVVVETTILRNTIHAKPALVDYDKYLIAFYGSGTNTSNIYKMILKNNILRARYEGRVASLAYIDNTLESSRRAINLQTPYSYKNRLIIHMDRKIECDIQKNKLFGMGPNKLEYFKTQNKTILERDGYKELIAVPFARKGEALTNLLRGEVSHTNINTGTSGKERDYSYRTRKTIRNILDSVMTNALNTYFYNNYTIRSKLVYNTYNTISCLLDEYSVHKGRELRERGIEFSRNDILFIMKGGNAYRFLIEPYVKALYKYTENKVGENDSFMKTITSIYKDITTDGGDAHMFTKSDIDFGIIVDSRKFNGHEQDNKEVLDDIGKIVATVLIEVKKIIFSENMHGKVGHGFLDNITEKVKKIADIEYDNQKYDVTRVQTTRTHDHVHIVQSYGAQNYIMSIGTDKITPRNSFEESIGGVHYYNSRGIRKPYDSMDTNAMHMQSFDLYRILMNFDVYFKNRVTDTRHTNPCIGEIIDITVMREDNTKNIDAFEHRDKKITTVHFDYMLYPMDIQMYTIEGAIDDLIYVWLNIANFFWTDRKYMKRLRRIFALFIIGYVEKIHKGDEGVDSPRSYHRRLVRDLGKVKRIGILGVDTSNLQNEHIKKIIIILQKYNGIIGDYQRGVVTKLHNYLRNNGYRIPNRDAIDIDMIKRDFDNVMENISREMDILSSNMEYIRSTNQYLRTTKESFKYAINKEIIKAPDGKIIQNMWGGQREKYLAIKKKYLDLKQKGGTIHVKRNGPEYVPLKNISGNTYVELADHSLSRNDYTVLKVILEKVIPEISYQGTKITTDDVKRGKIIGAGSYGFSYMMSHSTKRLLIKFLIDRSDDTLTSIIAKETYKCLKFTSYKKHFNKTIGSLHGPYLTTTPAETYLNKYYLRSLDPDYILDVTRMLPSLGRIERDLITAWKLKCILCEGGSGDLSSYMKSFNGVDDLVVVDNILSCFDVINFYKISRKTKKSPSHQIITIHNDIKRDNMIFFDKKGSGELDYCEIIDYGSLESGPVFTTKAPVMTTMYFEIAYGYTADKLAWYTTPFYDVMCVIMAFIEVCFIRYDLRANVNSLVDIYITDDLDRIKESYIETIHKIFKNNLKNRRWSTYTPQQKKDYVKKKIKLVSKITDYLFLLVAHRAHYRKILGEVELRDDGSTYKDYLERICFRMKDIKVFFFNGNESYTKDYDGIKDIYLLNNIMENLDIHSRSSHLNFTDDADIRSLITDEDSLGEEIIDYTPRPATPGRAYPRAVQGADIIQVLD